MLTHPTHERLIAQRKDELADALVMWRAAELPRGRTTRHT